MGSVGDKLVVYFSRGFVRNKIRKPFHNLQHNEMNNAKKKKKKNHNMLNYNR